MATEIKIGLSPEEVVAALKKMADESRNLQKSMEDALGRGASTAVNDLKDTSEKGANEITKFFSNAAARIKGDLKTAFDVSSIMAGANFAKQLGEGVKQVFDMEKAFGRLNIRMGLSAKQMEDFKVSASRATAEAGVNIKDVQGGLFSAASRGGVKDPEQMTMIAKSLAEAKNINPDLNTETMSDEVIDILKRQGIAVNGKTFGSTMDAISAATANGGFHNSGEAGREISNLAQFSTTNGMSTRQLAGIASVASIGGEGAQNVLAQILKAGGEMGGADRINGVLGQAVFKNGKIDAAALGRVNTKQFGSENILGTASGLDGANGGDLKMLVDSFRNNMGAFKTVVNGTNETADQFGKATDNFSSKLTMFKERVTAAGLAAGEGLGTIFTGLQKEDRNMVGRGLKNTYNAVADNAGDLALAGSATIGASLLMGGGIRGLMGTAAADATGTQKVYVTNADQMGGSVTSGLIPVLGQVALAATAGVAIGAGIVKLADTLSGGKFTDIVGKPGEWMANDVGNYDAKMQGQAQLEKNRANYNDRHPGAEKSKDEYSNFVNGVTEAVKKGTMEAHQNRPKILTQPSSVKGQNG